MEPVPTEVRVLASQETQGWGNIFLDDYISKKWFPGSFKNIFMKYNCFKMLYQFLLYNKVNQPYVYIYSLPLGPPFHPIPSPTPPTPEVITEHWAELPAVYSSFPLANYFTHGSVYITTSQFIPPSPSLPLCPHTHFLYLRLYSCPGNRFIYTILLDFVYTIKDMMFVFLSLTFYPIWQVLGSSVSRQMTLFHSF